MHDPNTTHESVDYFSLILALLFGLWGGVARYLNEVLQEKRQFHFFELWVSAMISGFCGVLIGLVALHFAMEVYLVMFGSGMAGGIGWQTVGWLFTLAKKRAARLAGRCWRGIKTEFLSSKNLAESAAILWIFPGKALFKLVTQTILRKPYVPDKRVR